MIVAARRAGMAYPSAADVLFAALAFLFIGCSTTTKPPAPPQLPVPQWESDKLIDSITQRRQQFRSVRALARVNYAGPEGKHGFEEAVMVQRPDRLRLETLTMLGAILIVTANNQEIIGYHPREGVLVRGRSSKENLLRLTQIPLELEEVTALLLGLPPVEPSASWRREGNSLVFLANSGTRDSLTFESQLPVPTRWQRFNGSGGLELTANFSEYITTPAGLFPSKINIEAPRQGKKLEIRFQEPEFNASLPAESFSQQKPLHVQEFPIEMIGS